jgi:beta-phosphoglucomutase family hydrolase
MTGVIFDMDGVLVASAAPHMRSWQILAQNYGLEISPETFRATFGKTSRDIIREIWGPSTSEEDLRRLDREKEAAYRELITGCVPLMPGCREVLQRLRAAGCGIAVATSGPPENLELVLSEGLIASCFDAEVHGFNIFRGKPAPDCFLLAAERLGIPPSQCVVVEDAPVGIAAARAANMPAIALVGTHPRDVLAATSAACIVDSLGEITVEMVRGLLPAS